MRTLWKSTLRMMVMVLKQSSGEKQACARDTSACSECASGWLFWVDSAKSRASPARERPSASSSRANGYGSHSAAQRVLSRLRGSLPQRTLPASQLTAARSGGAPGHPRFVGDPLRRATRCAMPRASKPLVRGRQSLLQEHDWNAVLHRKAAVTFRANQEVPLLF